jgi:hypothetical protein
MNDTSPGQKINFSSIPRFAAAKLRDAEYTLLTCYTQRRNKLRIRTFELLFLKLPNRVKYKTLCMYAQ